MSILERQRHSRGAILILVAGISALLATMSLAFIYRIRAEGEDVQVLERFTQSRLMMQAGLSYVQESSRLGYGARASGQSDNIEAFGWMDVRGSVMNLLPAALPIPVKTTGPYGAINTARPLKSLDPLATLPGQPWPIDLNPMPLYRRGDWRDLDLPIHLRPAARFPMFAIERPPFAINPDAAPNPMGGPYRFGSTQVKGDVPMGWPFLVLPDVSPVRMSGVSASDYHGEYINGDLRPRTESVGKSWFRVFRDGPTTFVITVGSGTSEGFKNWSEVLDPNGDGSTVDSEASKFNSQQDFEHMVSTESRMWFRCEWSPRIGDVSSNHHVSVGYIQWSWTDCPSDGKGYVNDNYFSPPYNASTMSSIWMSDAEEVYGNWSAHCYSRTVLRNYVGSFLWIQRLQQPPVFW